MILIYMNKITIKSLMEIYENSSPQENNNKI